MIPENIKTLIEKLIKKTNDNQAIWTKTSLDNEFKLDLEKGAITTDNFETTDGEIFVDLVIRNENGDIIENVRVGVSEKEDYKLITGLHNIAKRKYYRVEETIKTIFEELDSDKIIGKKDSHFKEEDLPF